MSQAPTYFEADVRLDRNSPVPLYHQIAQPIEDMILSGQLTPGTRLEDELSMARRLNVSRPTARRALQQLGDHGLLVRRRGVGTQVAPTRVHRPNQLQTVFDQMKSEGRKPTTEVLSYGSSPASAEVAAKLEIAPGTNITTIRRLRLCDHQPVGLMFDVVRSSIAPAAIALERDSFESALAERGIIVSMARQTVSARKATNPEAQLLRIPTGSIVLNLQNISYDESGKVTTYGEYLFRADRFALKGTLFAH
ncbi:MAG: GntR family transcriptional regulator [Mobiluncus sp.]|uniref:GntR family transcriptional regulator n=1 Tax=Mobiluncus sp. TaxID=47293 RepID=UPI00258E25B4|nr:GntR family transcriptional regulator [Mobiluncus sp.]MCI6583833.1 GntR family transcriptional regulator [Mobiluncus sp.]